MISRVCSLFAGIGGIDLGFQQAGFNVVWANAGIPESFAFPDIPVTSAYKQCEYSV